MKDNKEAMLAEWSDTSVRLVYELLCSEEIPPQGEHWEGYIARRIVGMLNQHKEVMNTMTWISVEDKLPENGQAVLVRRSLDNWHDTHILADGSVHEIWRWKAVKFMKGLTKEEAEIRGYYSIEDQHGNNKKPYCWEEFGPCPLFGQGVSHWAAITNP